MALSSESLPAVNLAHAPQDYAGGDPMVILLVTFVDWVKKIFVTDARTDARKMDGQT